MFCSRFIETNANNRLPQYTAGGKSISVRAPEPPSSTLPVIDLNASRHVSFKAHAIFRDARGNMNLHTLLNGADPSRLFLLEVVHTLKSHQSEWENT